MDANLIKAIFFIAPYQLNSLHDGLIFTVFTITIHRLFTAKDSGFFKKYTKIDIIIHFGTLLVLRLNVMILNP